VAWAKREYNNEEVDAAGKVLAHADPNSDELDRALAIINNWRSSHNFPLNTFQCTLRRKAKFDPESLIAQRIKRLRAIRYKLQKRTLNPIPLSEMQDVGGCRAVFKTVANVRRLRDAYIESDLKHKLVQLDDYIEKPKNSGYRGIHLVYAYNSDRSDDFNGIKIEVQMRSQLQHAWATAVEIVGFFRKELLKSGEGDHVWKHFFKLMASEIAIRENCETIPKIPATRSEIKEQVRKCVAKLDAMSHLHAYGQGLKDVQEVETEKAHYFLLELDAQERKLKITGYKIKARLRASLDYADIERALLGTTEREAVLVSVESMVDLKRVYSNYFLEMRRFIEIVEQTAAP
jgi:ppGpp synthetase/RelA/SpoT-type nucleotidyltranferase